MQPILPKLILEDGEEEKYKVEVKNRIFNNDEQPCDITMGLEKHKHYIQFS